jgi:hypothetical protein
MTTATNRLPIKERPTLRLKLGPAPAPVGKPAGDPGGSVEVLQPAPPARNRTPAPETRRHVPPTPPTLNAVEIPGRARRAERRAAVAAEAAEAEKRAGSRAIRDAAVAAEKAARAERQAVKEAKLQRVLEMHGILCERWPALFKMLGPRLPMKLGIHRDVIEAAPDLHAGDVRKAIRFYALSGSYTEAVVAGAVRYNLYGQPAGVVTETEARWP